MRPIARNSSFSVLTQRSLSEGNYAHPTAGSAIPISGRVDLPAMAFFLAQAAHLGPNRHELGFDMPPTLTETPPDPATGSSACAWLTAAE